MNDYMVTVEFLSDNGAGVHEDCLMAESWSDALTQVAKQVSAWQTETGLIATKVAVTEI